MSQVAKLFLYVNSKIHNINPNNSGRWQYVELKTDEKSKNVEK